MSFFSYEAFGYFASGLVVLSLTMRSLLKLRVLNLIGAGTMACYGLLIEAYPVLFLNVLIVGIDVYYLHEMLSQKHFCEILEVRQNSKYLAYFLGFYEEEIHKFLPQFAFEGSESQRVLFVLRNLVPAGVFITHKQGADTLLVKLDFVIPGYRDLKIGRFVFKQQREVFRKDGIRRILSDSGTPKHEAYLRKMGFAPVQNGGRSQYCLSL